MDRDSRSAKAALLFSIWRTMIDIRTAELRLSWTKFYLIILINGGLLAMYHVVIKSKALSIIWCLLGFAFSLLGWLLIRGSYWWVQFWEEQLKEMEEMHEVFYIFSSHPRYTGLRHISTFKIPQALCWLMIAGWVVFLCWNVVGK